MIPTNHSEAYELFDTTSISRSGYSDIVIARYRSVKKHPQGAEQEAKHHYMNMLYQDGTLIRRIDDYDHAIRYCSWLFKRQTKPKPLKYKAVA